MARLAKTELLILDDFGLTPLSGPEARDLLEVIDERTLTRSTLVASQLPLEMWHGAIAGPHTRRRQKQLSTRPVRLRVRAHGVTDVQVAAGASAPRRGRRLD